MNHNYSINEQGNLLEDGFSIATFIPNPNVYARSKMRSRRIADELNAHVVLVARVAELEAVLRDMTMCFGNSRDADVDNWWEFRCDWEQGADAIRYETLMAARAALAKGQA